MVGAGIQPPPECHHPVFDHDDEHTATLGKPKMWATSRQPQPKVQCIVPTTTNNISRVIIQAAIES